MTAKETQYEVSRRCPQVAVLFHEDKGVYVATFVDPHGAYAGVPYQASTPEAAVNALHESARKEEQ